MTLAITAATRVAGVTGWPIDHSLSPRLHNAWLRALGLDAVYVAFPVRPAAFGAFAEGLRGGVIAGLNVTAPHKEMALALSDTQGARARRAGAANLLLFTKDGPIAADNTDGEGLLAAFAAQAPSFDARAAPVLILGSGGAARGAAAAFVDAGVPQTFILSRRKSAADAIAAAVGPSVTRTTATDLGFIAPRLGAVVNATPSGLEAAKDMGLDLSALKADAVVMDMVYRPLETSLLKAARDRGLQTVDGLEMLIGQARPSFTALFDAQPPDLNLRAVALAS